MKIKSLATAVVVACGASLMAGSNAMADSIGQPIQFIANTLANSGEVNSNFNTIYDQVNKIGSVINIDSVNNRVGIGSTGPKSKLSVVGLPSGTTSSVVSGDTSGVAGAVCITNEGNMYIDTDGSCAN